MYIYIVYYRDDYDSDGDGVWCDGYKTEAAAEEAIVLEINANSDLYEDPKEARKRFHIQRITVVED